MPVAETPKDRKGVGHVKGRCLGIVRF